MGTIQAAVKQRSIQSKLSLKTSDQVKIRSGSRNSQSKQLICVQEVDSEVGKWSIFDEGQFCIKFYQISSKDTWDDWK